MKYMFKNLRFSVTLLLVTSLFSAVTYPQNTDVSTSMKDKGLAIAKEVQVRDSGWSASSSNMTMILSNKSGRKSQREMSMKTLEIQNDGDKSLTTFNEPRDVKGTSFLSFSHALKADQQWLYLPALKRVKRISSSNKSGPFLGSEFAFEDLSSFEVEKFDYEFLKEDEFNGKKVFVVKYIPQYEHSGYQYMNVFIDQEEYVFQKIDYYDRKAELLKTMEFKSYKQFKDKYWRAMNYFVHNHQTGKSTELLWNDYTFDVDFNDADFNKNALKRSR